MSKFILRNVWLVVLLAACAPHARNSSSRTNENHDPNTPDRIVASDFNDVDTTLLVQNEWLAEQKPLPLTELPRTEDGAFVLAPGYYETDFKSYCLQPGSPNPSARDAYFQSPLRGYRRDIVETILRNSQKEAYL